MAVHTGGSPQGNNSQSPNTDPLCAEETADKYPKACQEMVHRVTCCRKVRRPKDQVLHLSAGPSLKAPVAFTVRHKGVRVSRTREPEGRDVMGMGLFHLPKEEAAGSYRAQETTVRNSGYINIRSHSHHFC